MASTAFRFPHNVAQLVEQLRANRDDDDAWRRFGAYLADNFRAIEDHLRLYEVQWSLKGLLTDFVGTVSTPYGPKNDQRLTEVVVWLGVADPTTATVVTVNLSGTPIGTVTVPATETQASQDFEDKVGVRSEPVTLELTSTGAAAEDLSAAVVFR